MNFGASVNADVGGSLSGASDAAVQAKDAAANAKGAVDAAANLKANVSGGVSGAADTAAGAKAGVSGAVSGAVGGVKDQVAGAVNSAKDTATGAVDAAKGAATAAVGSVTGKVSAAVGAAMEKAAAMKDACAAAKDKFKNAIAPPDGWKPNLASSSQISIGKSFSMGTGITLGGTGKLTKSETFQVEFEFNPDEVGAQDDSFTLFSTDAKKTFNMTKTVKDDLISGDDLITIEFTGLSKDLRYTLRIDPGKKGKPYNLFEDRTFGDWLMGVFRLEFDIDPRESRYKDDSFILYSTDDNRTYKQIKTISDDLNTDDAILELQFNGLDRTLSYSLEVDQGSDGESYHVFENRPFDELMGE